MSTSPDAAGRHADRIVTLLSRWLAGHLSNEQLDRELRAIGTHELSPGEAEAIEDVLTDLADAGTHDRAQLQVAVREALEALALGG